MGYNEPVMYEDLPVWKRYRDFFPVTGSVIYMNHAGVAPLCRPAAEAMRRFADDALNHGALHYDEWMAACEGLRASAARLIGAGRGEIAIVKNTSEGIATVALGLDWRPGDKIVAFQEEFGANYFPWKKLEERGVKIEWVSIWDSLDRVDQACRGARLLTISFVQYLSGRKADLDTLGEICNMRGCLFFVDAIQGLGAFPLDVRRSRIHALAADGHKWLLGPEGCAILYIHKNLQDSVRPVELGWTNFAHFSDYGSRDMTLRPDASRYECGTLNTVGCFGLKAAIDFLLLVGVDKISAHLWMLGDRIAQGVPQKGYELLGRRGRISGSGIVSFRRGDVDSGQAVHALRDKKFLVAARQGWIRASPHFYISPEEVDEFLEALP